MITTNQLDALIRNAHDGVFNAAIDIACFDHDEVLALVNDPDDLAKLATEYDTSPATISRIAQHLTNAFNYAKFCDSYDLCSIHRCDYEICKDEGKHPYNQ